jgi:glycosyltransferase involved in cell wall biosynthesis
MRVIVCHNFYQQPGGEDRVFRDEAALLEAHGHEVALYSVHNDTIRGRSRWAVAADTIWNRRTAAELGELIRRFRPDVVHFHNTFPLISPAAYHAARTAGAAVVQTLHNFRLICPKATLTRNGGVCEQCLGKRLPWPAVFHGCYRGDRQASAVVAALLSIHRLLRTWDCAVDRYIALTESARQKLIEGGLPAEKVMVKGNFVSPSPEVGKGQGGYALFVGRLVPEKGLDTLLAAWPQLSEALPLKIVGDGPCSASVREAARHSATIEWLGARPHAEVQELLGDAMFLVLPSIWYEGFPKILVEAFSKGTPVVASRLGAMLELVDDGRTGLHFTPGDAADLARKIGRMLSSREGFASMRLAARGEFDRQYTAEANYVQLMDVYREALRSARLRSENLRPAARETVAGEDRNGDIEGVPRGIAQKARKPQWNLTLRKS